MYISDFYILKIVRMTQFYNLFMEQPSNYKAPHLYD